MNNPPDESMRTYSTVSAREKGTGPGSAGQSGDTQGLSDVAEAGSESVVELVEEGQSFEAEAIEGVEDAPDGDVAEVTTKEVPQDDVPSEYQGPDEAVRGSPRGHRSAVNEATGAPRILCIIFLSSSSSSFAPSA